MSRLCELSTVMLRVSILPCSGSDAQCLGVLGLSLKEDCTMSNGLPGDPSAQKVEDTREVVNLYDEDFALKFLRKSHGRSYDENQPIASTMP
ncbi:hypothetical protein NDU88_003634 [Pleurodeles waltl]|uniref:Uncharacterized protein n=1 Tax=Pleurodeles waltl TaxID=8319 RepID=A0AAV7M7K0_PLEWA|nr:hypothetical protein NDU88_003634 [Pleurodeles waltl]